MARYVGGAAINVPETLLELIRDDSLNGVASLLMPGQQRQLLKRGSTTGDRLTNLPDLFVDVDRRDKREGVPAALELVPPRILAHPEQLSLCTWIGFQGAAWAH